MHHVKDRHAGLAEAGQQRPGGDEQKDQLIDVLHRGGQAGAQAGEGLAPAGADPPEAQGALFAKQPRQVGRRGRRRARHRGQRRARGAQVEEKHQRHVEPDVHHRARQKARAGPLLLPVGPQVIVEDIVEEDHRRAQGDQPHVGVRLAAQRLPRRLCAQQPQDLTGKEVDRQGQQAARRQGQPQHPQEAVHRLLPPARAQKLGVADAAADAQAVHEEVDDHEQRQGHADGGQAGFAHPPAHHQRVGHVGKGQAHGGPQRGHKEASEHFPGEDVLIHRRRASQI